MTNVGPRECISTLDGVTELHTSRKPSLSSQTNASSYLVTPEKCNQGNVDAMPPVKPTLDGVTETAVVNNQSYACTASSVTSTLDTTLDGVRGTMVHDSVVTNKPSNTCLIQPVTSIRDGITETSVHNELVTPDSNSQIEKDATLPDLVSLRTTSSALDMPIPNTQVVTTQPNSGEFDFPALLSDDENNTTA